MMSCLRKRSPKATPDTAAGPSIAGSNMAVNAQGYLNATNQERCQNGVPPVQWSSTLANSAQNWANHLCSIGKMEHSGSGYGENLYWSSGSQVNNPASVAGMWYNEQPNYNFSNPGTSKNGQMIGHFTQAVWKNTTQMGCGESLCGAGGSHVVCQYNPPGNVDGQYGANVLPQTKTAAQCSAAAPAPSTGCPNGLPVVASAQQCGAGKGCCPGNECCSQYGWCSGASTGTASAPWCGSGCQSSYGKCGVAACKTVKVTVNTQSYGEECGWSIPGTSLASAPGAYACNSTYTKSACIPPGTYTFKATDSYGDGWNGSTFSISVNGTQVVGPTTFQTGSSFSKTFTV